MQEGSLNVQLRIIPPSPVIALGHEMLAQYGLVEEGWTFELSREKKTLGRCFHGQKLITFSEYYLHIPEDDIQDTILHEIAHALVGPNHGHDFEWRQMCEKIGAKPERLAPPELKTAALPNYYMECPECLRRWYRFRMRRRNFGSTCPDCQVPVAIYKYRR